MCIQISGRNVFTVAFVIMIRSILVQLKCDNIQVHVPDDLLYYYNIHDNRKYLWDKIFSKLSCLCIVAIFKG